MIKNLNSISLLAFFIVLYVARNAMPYAVYPLIVLLFPFTIYQLINIKSAKQTFVRGIKMFAPIILLIVIELAALFLTVYPFQHRSLDILKDIIFISVFLFLLSSLVQNKYDFEQLVQYIGKYFVLFSIVISILGLWKFFYSPSFISYNTIDEELHFNWGASLVSDYNFFALFLYNGLIFGLYKILHSPNKIKYKMLFLLALQLILFTELLSGSRRFMFCLAILFITCLFLLIPYLYKKLFSKHSSYKYLLVFLTFSVFNLGITYFFLSYFLLITEKAEKILFINGENISKNILVVSIRINSAVSYNLIKVHTKDKILNDNNIIPLTSSRKALWILGKKIYREYTIPRKIFGHGFSFFKIFQKETEVYSYPHHLFLSVLLFSGIIGLGIYIAVLFWSSFIYLFHLKELKVLFFLFTVNFIFGFFSFTDFLGATFYALLLIFPLLYRDLYKQEKRNENKC